jgi:ATP-binding cassette subfamily B protein
MSFILRRRMGRLFYAQSVREENKEGVGTLDYHFEQLENAEALALSSPFRLILDSLALFSLSFILFRYDLVLSVTVLVLLAGLTAIHFLFQPYLNLLQKNLLSKAIASNRERGEQVANLSTLKNLAMEEEFRHRAELLHIEMLKEERKFHSQENIFSGLQNFMCRSAWLYGIWFSASLCLNRRLSPGDVMAIHLYLEAYIQAVKNIMRWRPFLNKIKTSFAHVDKIFIDPITINPRGHSFLKGSITLSNISFSYPNKNYALRDLSFSIKPGEWITIVGPSGSGKTTLAKILAGLYQPTDGILFFEGVNAKELDPLVFRRQIAFVPFNAPGLGETLEEDIGFGDDDPSLENIGRARQIAYFEEEAGILEPKTLSSGQRQRACLARALYRNPEILILDESFSGVESDLEKESLSLIREKMAGKTVIHITHRLSSLIKTDRVIVLEKGSIQSVGRLRDMEDSLLFQKIFESQQPPSL